MIESNIGNIIFTNSGSYPNHFEGKGGVVELNIMNNQITIYDTTNNILDGLNGISSDNDDRYLTINQINKDPEGNIWILNPYSEVNNYLAAVQFNNGENWGHISAPDNSSYLPTEVAFDHTGLAWFGFEKGVPITYSSGGLKVLDTKRTYDNLSDDLWLTLINPEVLPKCINMVYSN